MVKMNKNNTISSCINHDSTSKLSLKLLSAITWQKISSCMIWTMSTNFTGGQQFLKISSKLERLTLVTNFLEINKFKTKLHVLFVRLLHCVPYYKYLVIASTMFSKTYLLLSQNLTDLRLHSVQKEFEFFLNYRE